MGDATTADCLSRAWARFPTILAIRPLPPVLER
jgi:hypothetical protein